MPLKFRQKKCSTNDIRRFANKFVVDEIMLIFAIFYIESIFLGTFFFCFETDRKTLIYKAGSKKVY